MMKLRMDALRGLDQRNPIICRIAFENDKELRHQPTVGPGSPQSLGDPSLNTLCVAAFAGS